MADLGSLLGAAGIGGAIGQAIVRLELDTKKYYAELNGARAQTTTSANAMGTGFAQFGGLAKTAMLGAGVAVAAFGAISVKAAIEANEAHLKLSNTFENNARLSDSSVEAFEAQADALRDLTGVDDEAIVSGQALLGQFRLTGEQVMQLTPAIVDLSAKMGIDLEAAFKAVGKATSGSAGILSRYGIVLNQNALKADAFGTTLKGLGVASGFAEKRADAEPWRVLGAQFEELAEAVGQVLIPALRAAIPLLTDLLQPLIFLSEQLEKISPTLEVTDQIVSANERWHASAMVLFNALDAGRITTEEFDAQVAHLGATIEGDQPVVHAQILDWLAAGDAAHLAESDFAALAPAVEGAGKAAGVFADLSQEAFKELASDLEKEIPALIGTVTTFKDTFTLSPNDLKKITDSWARIAKTIASDLKVLAESDLKPQMAAAIAALPPEMRHAWVEGNKAQRRAIEASIKATLNFDDVLAGVVSDMRNGGHEAGKAFSQGVVAGIKEFTPEAIAAIRNQIAATIAAARAAAGAASPSKKMHELGVDMIEGLIQGLTSQEASVVAAYERVIDKMIAGFEKQADALKDRLSKLQGIASSFRDSIAGGFGEFLDISGAFGLGGADITSFFAQQVAGAEQFASILKALQTQGISSVLLAQIASAGPQAIPFAQQLLQMGPEGIAGISGAFSTISGLASQTAKGLSEAFYGTKMDELRDELRGLRSETRLLHDLLERPQRVSVEVRPGSDRAVRQLITQVIGELGLSRQPL